MPGTTSDRHSPPAPYAPRDAAGPSGRDGTGAPRPYTATGGDDEDLFAHGPAPDPYGPGGRDGGPGPYGGGGRPPYGTGRRQDEPYGAPDYRHEGGFFGSQGGGLAGSRPGGPGSGGYGQGGYDRGGYGQGGHGQGGYGQGGYGAGGPGGTDGPGEGGPSAGDPGGGRGRGGSRGPGGPGDDHGEGRRRTGRRRSLSALIGPLAGAVGLAILCGAGVYALADSSGCAGGDAIDLKVAAAPDIAPAINDVVTSFNKDRNDVDGKCVKATVKASDPSAASTVLSGQGAVPGEIHPDVWIPDSSMWVALVRSTPKGASSVHLTPTTVAETPIVVATSRAFATRIHDQGIRPTWDMLLKATDALAAGAVSKNDMLPADSVHLQILDPTRNAGGLGAVVMTRTLLQGDPNATAIFTQITRKVQNSVSPNTAALFASFHRNLHGKAPVIIVPEQAVWKYNRGRPATPASAVYPSEGMLSLDYPFALATDDDVKIRAAGLLEKAMATEKAHAAVRAIGFRTPDGRAGGGFTAASGLSPRVPRALPTPSAGDVTDVMQAWTKLSLRTRMLTLLDVSGSMAQPVGGGVTRMEATAQVAQGGLAMLPDDTDLGLWTFSTNLDGARDYRTEVPIGPLSTRLGSATRRQAILTALGRVRPVPSGNTGLYDSVLASFRSMQRSYKVGYYNSILVLTDGKNDDANGISLRRLLQTLKREGDPARPVQVIFIGFGPDVDMASMQKIAAETDGAAYHAMKPQEVRQIFLNSIARRICAPQCP